MSDRVLLEAAARAAGLTIECDADKAVVFPSHYSGGFSVLNDKGGSSLWNPLTDDGDNARLRRKLRIVVQWFPTDVAAMHWTKDGRGRSWPEPYGDDPDAAERRAVVRAAAALAAQKT